MRTVRRLLPALVLPFLAALAAAGEGTKPAYPETRRGDDADVMHEERVADPYRWLEDDAAAEVVSWDLQQEILMRHLLLARERQPLGQRVEHTRQLQPPQDGLEIRRDPIGRGHEDSSPSAAAPAKGSLYCVGGRR